MISRTVNIDMLIQSTRQGSCIKANKSSWKAPRAHGLPLRSSCGPFTRMVCKTQQLNSWRQQHPTTWWKCRRLGKGSCLQMTLKIRGRQGGSALLMPNQIISHLHFNGLILQKCRQSGTGGAWPELRRCLAGRRITAKLQTATLQRK